MNCGQASTKWPEVFAEVQPYEEKNKAYDVDGGGIGTSARRPPVCVSISHHLGLFSNTCAVNIRDDVYCSFWVRGVVIFASENMHNFLFFCSIIFCSKGGTDLHFMPPFSASFFAFHSL